MFEKESVKLAPICGKCRCVVKTVTLSVCKENIEAYCDSCFTHIINVKKTSVEDLAFANWVLRGKPNGSPELDWKVAEKLKEWADGIYPVQREYEEDVIDRVAINTIINLINWNVSETFDLARVEKILKIVLNEMTIKDILE